jgi:Leucine-rich repeat (LRR) protein
MASFEIRNNALAQTGPLCLEALPKLRRLDLANNSLDAFSAASSDSLLELDLSENQLSEIVAGDLGSLQILNASRNLLERFSVGSLDSLAVLDLSGNRLRYFDRQNFSGLASLDLSGNLLEQFSVDGPFPEGPVNLTLSHNQLTELPGVGGGAAFQLLDVSNNRLTRSNFTVEAKIVNLRRVVHARFK